MPACTPVPPPLAAVVREATAMVSARVAPIPPLQACLAGDVPPGSAMATPGAVWFAAADASLFSMPPQHWSADRHVSVLHEVLHQVGMARGLEEGGQMDLEEGVVEAVAHDLRPAWLTRMIGRDRTVRVAYPRWVANVRIASAVATRRPWTGSAARAWRLHLLATPPPNRQMPVART